MKRTTTTTPRPTDTAPGPLGAAPDLTRAEAERLAPDLDDLQRELAAAIEARAAPARRVAAAELALKMARHAAEGAATADRERFLRAHPNLARLLDDAAACARELWDLSLAATHHPERERYHKLWQAATQAAGRLARMTAAELAALDLQAERRRLGIDAPPAATTPTPEVVLTTPGSTLR